MLKFGDTFRYKEKEMVYLAQTADILYAALILPQDQSEDLNRLQLKNVKDGSKTGRMLNNKLYCFVVLTTDEFKSRIAHLGNTQQDESTTNDCARLSPTGTLNNSDLIEIKKEIESGHVPEQLKELTKDITIK